MIICIFFSHVTTYYKGTDAENINIYTYIGT